MAGQAQSAASRETPGRHRAGIAAALGPSRAHHRSAVVPGLVRSDGPLAWLAAVGAPQSWRAAYPRLLRHRSTHLPRKRFLLPGGEDPGRPASNQHRTVQRGTAPDVHRRAAILHWNAVVAKL